MKNVPFAKGTFLSRKERSFQYIVIPVAYTPASNLGYLDLAPQVPRSISLGCKIDHLDPLNEKQNCPSK